MKKTVKIVAVMMLAVMLCLAFVSCGKKLSGEYKLDAFGVGSTTYSFSGSKVEITTEIAGFTKTIEGEYEITTNEDDKEVIIFTFDAEEEDAEDYEGEYSFAEGKEGDTEYIKIGGIKYTKVAK